MFTYAPNSSEQDGICRGPCQMWAAELDTQGYCYDQQCRKAQRAMDIEADNRLESYGKKRRYTIRHPESDDGFMWMRRALEQ